MWVAMSLAADGFCMAHRVIGSRRLCVLIGVCDLRTQILYHSSLLGYSYRCQMVSYTDDVHEIQVGDKLTLLHSNDMTVCRCCTRALSLLQLDNH